MPTVSSLFFRRIGRRPAFLICMLIRGLFGVGIASVPDFYLYMAFKCVVGTAEAGIMIIALVLGE